MHKPTNLFITGTGVPAGALAQLAYSGFREVSRVRQDAYWGWAPLDDAYQRHLEHARYLAITSGQRIVVGGHSQGALMAVRLGYEHPELVRGVVSISGPHNRIQPMPTWMLAVGKLMPSVRDMLNPERIAEHRHKVATQWSPDVPLWLVAVAGDVLVRPRRAAFDLDLPVGTDVHKYYFGPRRPHDLPMDVRYKRALLGTGHITEIFTGAASQIMGRACQPRLAA